MTNTMAPALDVGKVTEIALADLHPDSGQPRRSFDDQELQSLVESIKERGILQPIQVRSMGVAGLMIVDGERRWRAAKLAKLKTVPAILVAPAENLQQLRVDQVAVNQLRAGLSPLELGFLLKQLRDEVKLTANEIAAHLQKNGLGALAKQEVDSLIALTELPGWTHDMVTAGSIEVKTLAPLKRFKDQPAVMKALKPELERAVKWGGKATGSELSEALGDALAEAAIDLTESEGESPVLFDWKKVCAGCKDLVRHDGGAWCLDEKRFKQHQAEAKEAGLGPGGKRIRGNGAAGDGKAAGEREPTAAEKRARTEQRKASLGEKATDYLHAYLMRALVPKIDDVGEQLLLFAGQDHKIYALDDVLAKRTAKQRAAVVRSIALETLFELPFRETQVLAHHVLGDDIAKIWKLEPAFLELFRKAELVHLAQKHKIPEPDHAQAWEAMKGAELKMAILEQPQLLRKPQILVDLYARIDKPDRDPF